ncbi:MAG: hypothetical protein AAGD01_06285 [Acidobacteriota bacterium]
MRLAALVFSVALITTAMLATQTATAQNPDETCAEQLDAMYDEFASNLHGLERQRDPMRGSLRTGQRNSVRIDLSGGSQYFIGGACDLGCDLFDLVLRDRQGNIVAADTENDDVPIIDFIPDDDGVFTLEAQMRSCNSGSCVYHVGSFFQDNPWLSQCHQQLEAAAEALADDYPDLRQVVEPIVGSLDDGRSLVEEVRMGRGDYLILGVCDGDCSDLNLIAKENGQIIDRDLEDDDYPVLAIESTAPGPVDVTVQMATCDVSPCFFGLGIYTF